MALIPTREDIAKFRWPVSEAVLRAVDLYQRLLTVDPSFGPADLYVSPYLANHLPDLVVANARGILVLEVFGGVLNSQDACEKFELTRGRAHLLRAVFRDLCFPPVSECCAKLNLPHPDSVATRVVLSFINAAVIAPDTTTEAVREASRRGPIPVYGAPENAALAPWPSTVETKGLTDEQRAVVFNRLWLVAKSWLAPPYHRAEDGTVGQNQLTRSQRPHALPRGAGWFRLQGPTGSGKSMVLAHKAAVLASEGKRVLIICFNITLRSYLHDLVGRMRYGFDWRNVTIRHFHELLKEVRLHFNAPVPGNPNDKETFLEKDYPECAERLLSSHSDHRFEYDAVLIDEGQDFSATWFRVLSVCLKEDGELLLVRDRDQNLYDKDAMWCETGGPSIRTGGGVRGFSGPWAKLATAWRMSPEITTAVSEFAARMLGSERFSTDEGRQPTFFDAASFCRWDNVTQDQVNDKLIDVVTTATQKMSPTHPSDLAVLTTTNARAWEVVKTLEDAGLPAVHVYDSDGHRDREKLFHFCRGDGRVKVCTGHSFKGFEVWGVVVLAEQMRGDELRRWLYTAMGRAIEGLWVLNVDPALTPVLDWFPQSRSR